VSVPLLVVIRSAVPELEGLNLLRFPVLGCRYSACVEKSTLPSCSWRKVDMVVAVVLLLFKREGTPKASLLANVKEGSTPCGKDRG
jgi:hypothetical protein